MSKIEGTKVHKCIVCPQFDFSCSANLRAHVELHHYTPGYRCNVCEKMFKKSKDATAHVKNCQKYYPIIDGI
jgi:transposase-like protein